jgi:hypothetical protein
VPRPIRRVVIHTLTSAGATDCIGFGTVADQVRAWQNAPPDPPGWGASSHYLVDRDGTATQMVLEANVAFHATLANPDSIGIEHADICNKPDAYTTELYEGSAALVRDIASRNHFAIRVFGIDTNDAANATVVAHQALDPANRDDPGPYWDWEYYARLLRWDGRTPRTRPLRYVAANGAVAPAGWQVRRRVDVVGENRNCIPNSFCAQQRHSYGDTYWRAAANTEGSDMVFRVALRAEGLYKLSLWWPHVAGANPATFVHAEIQKAGGPARANVAFDQTRNFGRWNDLGGPFTFTVPGGGGAQVTLRIRRASPKAGFVLADALRVLRVA